MISTRLIATVAGLLFFLACKQTNEKDSVKLPEVRIDELDRHLKRLASDEFEGRMPFTEGERQSIEYLKEELQSMGLEPANGDQFYQPVPLVEITGHPAQSMTITGNNASDEWSLEWGKEYVAVTQRMENHTEIDASPLVFCGYGINAPEYGKNDYAGIDMEGKTAVVLVNDPGFGGEDSTYFKGDIMTYYGRWTYKYEEAARQGCDGVIIIHETASAGYPWFVVRQGWTGPQLVLASPDGNADRCAIESWISLDAAKQLFEKADMDLSQAIRDARKPDFQPVEMRLKASAGLNNVLKEDESQNVVAKITGTSKPEETVIYTAHWDHMGIGEPSGNDSIYNGAYDNATGCAALLEIARCFAEADATPERTVVFLFVTAEEQGLLGSLHYVENPLYPLDKTIANLNLDGANPFGKMRDVTVVGYGQNELEDLLAFEAKKQDRYLLPESEPEKGYYFRSDHFNFAKKGIPALFAFGGYDHWDKGKEYAKKLHEEYTASAYHRPEDNYNPNWDLTGMKDDAELLIHLGWKLANDTELHPEWKEGSEFSRQ